MDWLRCNTMPCGASVANRVGDEKDLDFVILEGLADTVGHSTQVQFRRIQHGSARFSCGQHTQVRRIQHSTAQYLRSEWCGSEDDSDPDSNSDLDPDPDHDVQDPDSSTSIRSACYLESMGPVKPEYFVLCLQADVLPWL